MNTNGNNFMNGHSGSNIANATGRSQNPELFDFKHFYAILKRYTWVIVACAIVGTGVAYYLAYQYFLPVYSSNSTLLIRSSANAFPGGTDEISKIISSSYNLRTSGSLLSQIHFLKSKELSNEVARQLIAAKYLPDGSKYPLLWKDYPDDSTVVSQQVVAGRIRRGIKVTPLEQSSNILSVSFESYSPDEASRVVNFSVNAYKDITADKKRESARSALKFLTNKQEEVKGELDQAEDQLSGFKTNKNLVAIQSQTTNVVNAVSQLQAKKQEIAVNLESVKSGIDNNKKELQAIKPGLGDMVSESAGPTIRNYQQQVAQLKTERLVLVSNNPQLKKHPQSEPRLRKLDKQIKDLQAAIKKMTNKLANSDNLAGLSSASEGDVTSQISKIRANLTTMEIQKNQYEAQIQAINQRLQNNKSFLNNVPDNQKQLARMQRQVAIYTNLYKTVSDQASQVSLWEQTQSSAGTVIDYATVSHAPVKPQKLLWLLGGFFVGLLLPVGFVLLREAASGKINSIDTLKGKKYPLLATIYHHSLLNKKKAKKISETYEKKNKNISKDLILYHYGLSPIAESYRSLVSKILYSNPDSPPKTILITSPGAGEGKTTLTANMAVGLVESGNRVLIIDADMRKPGLPAFLDIPKEPGIMDILFKKLSPEEAVHSLPIPGLDVLTTGEKQPARPTSVFGSQAFKRVLNKFRYDYDFILFDSAPYGIIGDVAPILHLTDGVIVNAMFLQTKQVELNDTIELLKSNSANILGVVLNGYNPRKSIDETEIKNLYYHKYNGYYDYQESKIKKKKFTHGKLS